MSTLLLLLRLFWPVSDWDCAVEDNLEVCERQVSTCDYGPGVECTVVVKRLRVKLDTAWCDLDDPLACLPDA